MTIRLNELITQLEALPQEAHVYYDFGRLIPTTIGSWRGVYQHLALGWDRHRYYGGRTDHVTVSSLLTILREAVNNTYGGYKGGDFFMPPNTPVWADNYGESNNTAILRATVGQGDYEVILHTAHEPYDWDNYPDVKNDLRDELRRAGIS